MACVATPSGCFHGVCRLQVVFKAFVASTKLIPFRLFLRRVSPSSLEPAFLARVAFTLVSWCLSYFALHLVFIARVAFNLFPWLVPPLSCFHGVCHLKVSGISSFRRLQTSFYNVLCPHFLFSSRVSLLGFLSLYSASIPFRLVCLWYFLLLI